ncbi:MAG TPA: PEP/pyruvate-binding domain-containing protein [Kofleriaceae bacterium]|nr:PEP/pyruvate-binding domain-containing protein [Kofleriaceae bacterium]
MAVSLWGGCGDNGAHHPCEVAGEPASLDRIDCREEFDALAARPLDASLPGAFTIKTIIDRADDDAPYFLDTERYPIHQRFAQDHLGWPPGMPFVGEYLYPQRRFLLGSITYFEEPDLWTYELAPYDTADAEMIGRALEVLGGASFFGDELAFHPTSLEQETIAAELDGVRVVTTEDIYRGATYQPLNLGETVAQVRLVRADDLDTDYVSPREIAVLDRVPNDISVVAAVVTEEFQTPLSHVNVLSQQRGTPNMALRDARAVLESYEGRWVRLTVGAFEWSVEETTQADADAWWDEHRPEPVEVDPPDATVTGFPDVDDLSLADISAVGGKAAQFGELRDVPEAVVRDGFAIPVRYYLEFIADNGFDTEIEAMLADPDFQSDGALRRQRLAELEADMRDAPLDPTFLADLEAHIDDEFPGTRMRFRSSSTAEDLDRFAGAGLYTSASGQVGDPDDPVADAVRTVWASLWRFRAFEERAYVSIDHTNVAMAVLVHPAYVSETAQGVAITANLFDPGPGGEDAFYINAQLGGVSVVQPPDSDIIADQLLYFYFHNNQPSTYFTHSSLVPSSETVLTRRQLYDLGTMLVAIRQHFSELYEPPPGFARLPLDVEFERIGDTIEIKQARPHPGRGQ